MINFLIKGLVLFWRIEVSLFKQVVIFRQTDENRTPCDQVGAGTSEKYQLRSTQDFIHIHTQPERASHSAPD